MDYTGKRQKVARSCTELLVIKCSSLGSQFEVGHSKFQFKTPELMHSVTVNSVLLVAAFHLPYVFRHQIVKMGAVYLSNSKFSSLLSAIVTT